MTQAEARLELDKFTSKIRIAEEHDWMVVLTPSEAKKLMQAMFPTEEREINL